MAQDDQLADIAGAIARLEALVAGLYGQFARLRAFIQREDTLLATAMDNLQAAVKKNTDTENSAIQAIQGLANQVKGVSNDPAVQTLADQINASADALAAAIVANTPAANPPAPTSA